MQKKLLLLFFVSIGFIAGVHAQTYGIKAGVNFADIKGNGTDKYEGLTSFHIGGIAELHITDHISFQPELLYTVKGAEINEKDYKLNYISMPIMLKVYISSDFNIHAGPTFSALLSETNSDRDGETLEYGLAGGLEYFFTDALFMQVRYEAGMTEIWEKSDKKNSVIQLSLGVQF